LLGDLENALQVLVAANRLPEAAFFARTYCPSKLSECVKLWKTDLATVNQAVADSLADPGTYPDLFPGFDLTVAAEQIFKQKRERAPTPAAKYADVKAFQEDFDVMAKIQELKPAGFQALINRGYEGAAAAPAPAAQAPPAAVPVPAPVAAPAPAPEVAAPAPAPAPTPGPEVTAAPEAAPEAATEEYGEEYEEDYGEEEFEPSSPGGAGPSPGDKVEEDKAAAAPKQEWNNDAPAAWHNTSAQAEAERQAAALKIQNMARKKQARKKVQAKREAKQKVAKGTLRADLDAGGAAADELERQRAALKIQSIARSRQARKATAVVKAEYDKDPAKKPKGYKQYSEYDGEGKDNPYFVKLNTKKKKKGSAKGKAGSVYLEQQYTYTNDPKAQEFAAKKIQSLQRGKMGRRKLKKTKEAMDADPTTRSKGYVALSEGDSNPVYEEVLKQGRKRDT